MTDPTPTPDRPRVVAEIRDLLAALDSLTPGLPARDATGAEGEALSPRPPVAASIAVLPIGVVESELRAPADAPRQGAEGAPDAWLVLESRYEDGLQGLQPGDHLVVLTWLDRADRTTLRVHPRDDLQQPLTGVFRTRSADRPNPIGLHQVVLREVQGIRLRVGPLEAVDGTPILDIKPVL